MNYRERIKELSDEILDEPDTPKPLNINIKTTELCDKCRFSYDNWCRRHDCGECERNPGEGEECECTTIEYGEPCPLYEEA